MGQSGVSRLQRSKKRAKAPKYRAVPVPGTSPLKPKKGGAKKK